MDDGRCCGLDARRPDRAAAQAGQPRRRRRPRPRRSRRRRRQPPRPADQGLPAGRAEDARGGAARLPAVPRRLEQDPHRARRDRRRQPALSDRAGAGRRRRHRHVQGRRRLHDDRRAHRARELPQAWRRSGRHPRRDLRRRHRMVGVDHGRRQEARRDQLHAGGAGHLRLPGGRTRSRRGRRRSRSPTSRSSS